MWNYIRYCIKIILRTNNYQTCPYFTPVASDASNDVTAPSGSSFNLDYGQYYISVPGFTGGVNRLCTSSWQVIHTAPQLELEKWDKAMQCNAMQ